MSRLISEGRQFDPAPDHHHLGPGHRGRARLPGRSASARRRVLGRPRAAPRQRTGLRCRCQHLSPGPGRHVRSRTGSSVCLRSSFQPMPGEGEPPHGHMGSPVVMGAGTCIGRGGGARTIAGRRQDRGCQSGGLRRGGSRLIPSPWGLSTVHPRGRRHYRAARDRVRLDRRPLSIKHRDAGRRGPLPRGQVGRERQRNSRWRSLVALGRAGTLCG
jgi:hypothetical protein